MAKEETNTNDWGIGEVKMKVSRYCTSDGGGSTVAKLNVENGFFYYEDS